VLNEDERTTPIGLFNYAHSYWLSAAALKDAKAQVTHPDAPVCFLYFHAIELYLKAYLRAEGHSVRDLLAIGHDAAKLREAAIGRGLQLDDEDVEVLTLMRETDAVIGSRYIRTGYFQRPTIEALDRTCTSLHINVGKTMLDHGFPFPISLPPRSR
jgi:HEPN domain-containing protein